MSTAANRPAVFASPPAVADADVQARPSAIPWYIWAGVLAITSSSIGGAWDVSWHRSIGRDTFWTPAHMAIQACAVVAAIICAWLVVKCTFFRDPELTAASVSVFGLRAPLGVFLAGWGGVAVTKGGGFTLGFQMVFSGMTDVRIRIEGGATASVLVVGVSGSELTLSGSGPYPKHEKLTANAGNSAD